MKLSYDFGTKQIEFSVEFRNRKTLSIEIEPPDLITVIAPEGATSEKILETVKSRSAWIVQKLFEIREIDHRKREKQFVNGESFLYLGRNYSLQMVVDPELKRAEVKMIRGKIHVHTPTRDEEVVKDALESWYKVKATSKINERVAYYQSYFDVKPTHVKIKDQEKRWGSCTSKGELLFNWKCIMAPSPVLDYIVVHEMCHLVHMDHSKEFWQLLKNVLPDFEQRKEWLRNHGVKLDL